MLPKTVLFRTTIHFPKELYQCFIATNNIDLNNEYDIQNVIFNINIYLIMVCAYAFFISVGTVLSAAVVVNFENFSKGKLL